MQLGGRDEACSQPNFFLLSLFMSTPLENSSKRIEAIDALRGFAVAAILLIHCSNQFLYDPAMLWVEPNWLRSCNDWSRELLYFCFENKAYAIFALLFGFTYALQWEKRAARGESFQGRMVWRMMLLIGFGLLNAVFFMGGDPLVFYALIMLFVIPLIRLSNRVLIIIALLAFAQIPDIIHSIHPIYPGLTDVYYTDLIAGAGEDNFLRAAYNNATVGVMAACAWGVETGRASQTLGLFLLGIVLYRTRFVEKPTRLLLTVGSAMFLLYWVLRGCLLIALFPALPVYTIYLNLFSALLMMIALLVFFRALPHIFLTRKLAIYGRMSLTNFIGGSMICGTLFYAWGGNLAAYFGSFLSIILGIVVLVIQIALSQYYLSRHKQGPFERIWHYLTWIVRE